MANLMFRLGEQVQRAVGQKAVNSKISRQEAMLLAGQACNKVLRDLIWRNKTEGIETVPYACFKEYTLGVEYDSLKDSWYAALPIRTLESLYNNRGIYHVAPADNPNEMMIPLDRGFLFMFKDLDSFGLEDNLGYIPERDRIYLHGATFDAEYEVFIRVVPDATSLAPDDAIPLPPELTLDALKLAIEIATAQISLPEDIQNNNLGN